MARLLVIAEARHAAPLPREAGRSVESSESERYFAEDWNRFSDAAAHSPGNRLVHEPLFRRACARGGGVRPWLASSWAWSCDRSHVTVDLSPTARWSDGAPVTSGDAKFTFDLPFTRPRLRNLWIPTYDEVVVLNERRLRIHYGRVASEADLDALVDIDILPRRHWETEDLRSWTNRAPIGSGPFTPVDCAPRRILLAVRPGWWGGRFEGVTHVEIRPLDLRDLGRTALDCLRAADWALVPDESVPRLQTRLPARMFKTYRTGGMRGVVCNAGRPPFDSSHLRRALYWAIDFNGVRALAGIDGPIAMSILDPSVHGALVAPDILMNPLRQRPSLARHELADSGYEVRDGSLVRAGRTFAVTLEVSESQVWVDLARVLTESWRQELGIRVDIIPVSSPILRRDKELGDFCLLGDGLTFGHGVLQTHEAALDPRYLMPIGSRAAANHGRWEHAGAQQLLRDLRQASDADLTRQLEHSLQRILEREVPIMPIVPAMWSVMIGRDRWDGWPTSAGSDYYPNPLIGPDAVLTLKCLRPVDLGRSDRPEDGL